MPLGSSQGRSVGGGEGGTPPPLLKRFPARMGGVCWLFYIQYAAPVVVSVGNVPAAIGVSLTDTTPPPPFQKSVQVAHCWQRLDSAVGWTGGGERLSLPAMMGTATDPLSDAAL